LKYYSFRVLKIQGKWVRVQDEYGDKGWIYKPLLWIQ
jgi:SH3-like domain-containing protein